MKFLDHPLLFLAFIEQNRNSQQCQQSKDQNQAEKEGATAKDDGM